MDYGLQRVMTRCGKDFLHCCWMVVKRCLIQRPLIWKKLDACAPILHPHIEAIRQKRINEVGLNRRPEDICPNPCAMNEQHDTLGYRARVSDVNEIAFETIPGSEWNHFIIIARGWQFLRHRRDV
jgi:hypothetical protein